MADKNNKDINGQPSGAQALGNYGSKLESVAHQLEVASKSFEANTAEYKRTTDNLTQTLREFAKAFGKEMKESSDYSSKQTQGNNQDLSKAYEKFTRGQEDNLTKGQVIGGALIKTAKATFSLLFKNFTRSFDRVLSNYNDNLEKITSRMQLSNAQYSQMLYRSTDWIRDRRLQKEFSQIDFSEALVPVLETGIRGGLAEEMAQRNMVMNRLLPMINTNTRAYTRMSKLFGEKFTQGIQAIGTYTSAYLQSAEGLEEGGYDTAIQTVYREIMERVRLQGGNATEVTSAMNQVLGSYSNLAATIGKDSAEKILQDYASFMRGESVMQGDIESLLPGITAKNASFEQYWQAMRGIITDNMSGMKSSYAATGFGFDVTVIQDVLNSLYFNSKEQMKDTETMMKGFNADTEYQKTMDNLTKGYYQSISDRVDNLTENAVSKIATFIGQTIPHFEDIWSTITKILSIWFPIIEASILKGNIGKSGSDATDLMTKLGSNSGSAMSPVGGGAGAGGIGTAGTATGTAVGAGSGATAGGIAIGAGGFLVGGALTGYDIYRELSSGNGVGSAALAGLLTGRGTMTSEREMSNLQKALSGQYVSFDWGSAGLNTVKGAGIGAGIGTASAGWAAGSGTIIGTVIGAIGGFFSNAIQQWIENAKFNKFADALKDATNAIDHLTETANDYNIAKQTQLSFEEAYAKIIKGDLQDGIKQLVSLFPDAKDRIEEITNKNDEYLIVLKKKVELETQRQQEQQASAFKNASAALRVESGTVEDIVSGKSSYYGAEAAQIASQTATLTGSSSEINSKFGDIVQSEYSQFLATHGLSGSELSLSDYVANINRAAGTTLIGYDVNTARYVPRANTYATKRGKVGELNTELYKNTATKFQKVAEQGKESLKAEYIELFDDIKDQYIDIVNSIPALDDILYKDDGTLRDSTEVSTYFKGRSQEYQDWKLGFQDLSSAIARAKVQAKTLGEEAETDWEYWAEGIAKPLDLDKYYEAFGVSPPQFKTGIGRVRANKMLAWIHDNEAVLPSSAADDLRQLAGTDSIAGMSNFLSALASIQNGRSVATPLTDSSMLSGLTNAIDSQTKTLSSILEAILDRVLIISNVIEDTQRRTSLSSTIPQSVLSYESVPLNA